jgi:MinD-like ATPase involved in chromosome partitioning or flagellar assembly
VIITTSRFAKGVVEELLGKSGRHCCLCHEYKDGKVELHHIVPRAKGGLATADNAIVLCFDCHAQVHAYSEKQPKGRKFSPSELRKHRDQWFQSRGHGGGASVDYKQLVGELLRQYIGAMRASEGETGVGAEEVPKAADIEGEVAKLASGATVMALFGPKGGIGKTTIAVNLAARLAGRGDTTVALVDGDTRFGDVAIRMDLTVAHSIADVGARMVDLDSESIKKYLVRHETGVAVLAAPLGPSEWANVTPQQINRVVGLLAQGHDYVVIDMPGTFDESIGTTLRIADIILLVTSMDVASVKDTRMALQMLRAANVAKGRVKLVINDNTPSYARREDVEDALDWRVEWYIPYGDKVSLSTQLGTPIVVSNPSARFSRVITEMAYALSGTPREHRGLVARLTRRAEERRRSKP